MNLEEGEILVPISALQHYVYCPRQCALIHVERVWEDNLFTLRGRRIHQRVDKLGEEMLRVGSTVHRVVVFSRRLGLVGKLDVLEFHGTTPYPVEYKAGAKGVWLADEVQLCAQAICLEEMMRVQVPKGAIFYSGSRRRREVSFSSELRAKVEETVAAVRLLLERGILPPPANDIRCKNCSLVEICMPYLEAVSLEEI